MKNIRITSDGRKTHVYCDDVELKDLTYIEFKHNLDCAPCLSVTELVRGENR